MTSYIWTSLLFVVALGVALIVLGQMHVIAPVIGLAAGLASMAIAIGVFFVKNGSDSPRPAESMLYDRKTP